MAKINVNEISDELDFVLCKTLMNFNLERVMAKNGVSSDRPFILLLDSEDKASSKYVKYKFNDLENSKINGTPIDFSSMYENDDMKNVIRNHIANIMENSKQMFIPYIVQIPSDPERFRLFNEHKVNEQIDVFIRDIISENKDLCNEAIDMLCRISDVDALTNKHADRNISDEYKVISSKYNSDELELSKTISHSIIPATPKGIVLLLLKLLTNKDLHVKNFSKNLSGLKIALVGCNSKTTGKYLSELLPKLKSTVSLYHSKSIINKDEFKDYDVVISCVGNARMITKEHIGESNYDRIFIDVGVNIIDGKVVGDFNEDIRESNYNHFTPYIKGVGLLTRLSLHSNLVSAYHNYYKTLGGILNE